jgi:hypothetical protein
LYQRKNKDGKDNAHVPRNQVTILSLQTLASLWIGKIGFGGLFHTSRASSFPPPFDD